MTQLLSLGRAYCRSLESSRGYPHRLVVEAAPQIAQDPQLSTRLLNLQALEAARQALVEAYEDGRIDADDLPPDLISGLARPLVLAAE